MQVKWPYVTPAEPQPVAKQREVTRSESGESGISFKREYLSGVCYAGCRLEGGIFHRKSLPRWSKFRLWRALSLYLEVEGFLSGGGWSCPDGETEHVYNSAVVKETVQHNRRNKCWWCTFPQTTDCFFYVLCLGPIFQLLCCEHCVYVLVRFWLKKTLKKTLFWLFDGWICRHKQGWKRHLIKSVQWFHAHKCWNIVLNGGLWLHRHQLLYHH